MIPVDMLDVVEMSITSVDDWFRKNDGRSVQ